MFYAKSTNGFYDNAIHGSNIPSDAVEITTEQHCALIEAQSQGKIIQVGTDGQPVAVDPPAPTSEEARQSLVLAVGQHLEGVASERGYDSIVSLCSYATSTNPTFAAEGQAGIAWRDAVWAAFYDLMDEVESEAQTLPTADELKAALPEIVWP